MATELAMLHVNNVSIYSVHYCNLLGSRVLPEAGGSPATVQSLPGVSRLGCLRRCRWQDEGSRSGWPRSCRLCLVKVNTRSCSSGWLEKPRPVMSFLFLLQLSILTRFQQRKNMLHRPYHSCSYLVRSTPSTCHSSYTHGYRKGSRAVTYVTMT